MISFRNTWFEITNTDTKVAHKPTETLDLKLRIVQNECVQLLMFPFTLLYYDDVTLLHGQTMNYFQISACLELKSSHAKSFLHKIKFFNFIKYGI